MKRISVIMGVYNCATTLPEALDSLYSQTCRDFKIIMCDDGSTDRTFQVAYSYARAHDNIVLLKNEKNMGLNATLNRCLQHVDTEYVARMDGDDLSLPTRFEKEIRFLDEHRQYAFVSSPMIYFDEGGDFMVGGVVNDPSGIDFLYGRSFCHAPVMVRASAYQAVEGYTVSKYLLRLEDQDLWQKLYEKGLKGFNLDEPLYKMRDDRAACRRRNWINRRNEILMRLRICRNFKLAWWHYPESVVLPILKLIMPPFIYTFMHRHC